MLREWSGWCDVVCFLPVLVFLRYVFDVAAIEGEPGFADLDQVVTQWRRLQENTTSYSTAPL